MNEFNDRSINNGHTRVLSKYAVTCMNQNQCWFGNMFSNQIFWSTYNVFAFNKRPSRALQLKKQRKKDKKLPTASLRRRSLATSRLQIPK
jgi:hypothetical protein